MIATAADSDAIAARWTADRAVVAVFCAAWCDTCTEFRATVERIAAVRPETLFLWLDIEDDVELCGELDVDNFPTLAIYRGDALLHYGVSLPQESTVARLVDEVAVRGEPITAAPEPVLELPRAVRA
jgi:thioredoxin reductase (NADPH)